MSTGPGDGLGLGVGLGATVATIKGDGPAVTEAIGAAVVIGGGVAVEPASPHALARIMTTADPIARINTRKS
jgi:hypothetical protein